MLHCKHSTQNLEYLSATLPNDCAFCAHEQIKALADALEAMLVQFGPYGDDACAQARAALSAAGRLP